MLLNALDLPKRRAEVKIIIEGQATTLISDLHRPENPLPHLYSQVKEAGLIDGVCQACSTNTGSVSGTQAQGWRVRDDLHGHPPQGRYLAAGGTLLTF